MEELNRQQTMPALALRGLTVFPQMLLHFDVGRQASIQALDESMASGQPIFLVAQRELAVESPQEKDLYSIGTICNVRQILRLPGDNVRVMVEGGRRARLRRLWQTEPYLQGHVEVVEESAAVSHGPKTEALLRQTWGLFQDYAHLAGNVAEEVTAAVLDCQEPGYLADFIAQNTALRYDDKQAILEELSPLVRLRKLNGFLARERDVLGYERQMEGKVRDELAQQQKEQILRTQIRVLQNELGEDEDNEIEEYRQKLAELKLEDETREHLEKEIPVFHQVKRWLDIYFSGQQPDFMPPLHMSGTPFQMAVWETLREIPYGQTTTYGAIARKIARQRGLSKMSAQAVGQAVGRNELSILVPCHRVVGADGTLTGYGGGLELKRKLLELEGAWT